MAALSMAASGAFTPSGLPAGMGHQAASKKARLYSAMVLKVNKLWSGWRGKFKAKPSVDKPKSPAGVVLGVGHQPNMRQTSAGFEAFIRLGRKHKVWRKHITRSNPKHFV